MVPGVPSALSDTALCGQMFCLATRLVPPVLLAHPKPSFAPLSPSCASSSAANSHLSGPPVAVFLRPTARAVSLSNMKIKVVLLASIEKETRRRCEAQPHEITAPLTRHITKDCALAQTLSHNLFSLVCHVCHLRGHRSPVHVKQCVVQRLAPSHAIDS